MLGWVGWFGGCFVWGFCCGLVWFKKKRSFCSPEDKLGEEKKENENLALFFYGNIILHDGNSKESSSQGFLVMG